MWFLIPFLVTVLVIVSFLLVLIILMQRPKSQGLGAAFGGGTADSLFGAQTTSVLTKMTVWLGIAFFVITLLIAILYARVTTSPSEIQRQLTEGSAAVEEAADVTDVTEGTEGTEGTEAAEAVNPAQEVVAPGGEATGSPAPAAE